MHPLLGLLTVSVEFATSVRRKAWAERGHPGPRSDLDCVHQWKPSYWAASSHVCREEQALMILRGSLIPPV